MQKDKKIFINIFFILAIVFVIIWMLIEEYKESKIYKADVQTPYYTQNIIHEQNDDENNKKEESKLNESTTVEPSNKDSKKYLKEDVIEKYKGYSVEAKLEIPTISLETYVLKEYSLEALNVSVTKFWGTNSNEIGNYCIAGHNFKNKNMFNQLKKVKKGDKLFLIDNKTGRVEYEVYDLYQVSPNNVACLSQNTNGKREVTLITCTNDSKKRIIVKASEI